MNVHLLLLVLVFFSHLAWADVDGGYMNASNNGLVYLQLNQIGQSLHGYIQVVAPALDKPSAIDVKRYELQGSLNGRKIGLNVGGFFGLGVGHMDGSMIGKRISLSFPTPDGQLVTTIFQPTTEQEWNANLNRFAASQRIVRLNQLSYSTLMNRVNNLTNQFSECQEAVQQAKRNLPDAQSQLKQKEDERTTVNENIAEAQKELDKAREDCKLLEEKAKATGDADDQKNAGDAEERVEEKVVGLQNAEIPLNNIEFAIKELQSRVDKQKAILTDTPSIQEQIHYEIYLLTKSPLTHQEHPFTMFLGVTVQPGTVFGYPDTKRGTQIGQIRKGEQIPVLPTVDGWYIAIARGQIVWLQASLFGKPKHPVKAL
jgi:hypothetical protein